ncbi:Replication factor A protein 1 [Linum perenne]
MRSIPKYKFSFATEAYVNSHIDQSKQLTDVLGAVIHKEETRMLRWGTKSTPMKNIKLQFTNGYVICVSLWGPLATEMDKISDVAGERITILIVSSVYVKLFNGMVYLSTTGASKLYPDLDIPEVQPLMAVYGTKKYPAISKKIETVTIEQLNLLKENSANKDKVFMVQCIVSRVDNIWYYNGCANDRCLKKIEDVMDNYVCVFCDHKMIKTVARYRVSMNVFDSTGTAELVLMDREGVIYYGINAEELLSSLNGIDTEEAPAVLKNTVGKHLTFLIKLTAYSLSRKRSEYTIAKIMDEASNSGEMVDKEQKDGLLVTHSSSESLSSCVVQNEILTEAGAGLSHSIKVIDEELTTADDKVSLELSDATTIADAKMIPKKRKKPSVAGEQE